jgi:hypothetical protein
MAASDPLATAFAKHYSIGAGGKLAWVEPNPLDPLEAEFGAHYSLGGDGKLLWAEKDFAAGGGRGSGRGAGGGGGGGAASSASGAAPAPPQAARGSDFLKFGLDRHRQALENYAYMMSAEGGAFAEQFRAPVGCTAEEKDAKAAKLAAALQEAFAPTSQFSSRGAEPRAHNVTKGGNGSFTIRSTMHRKGAKNFKTWPETPCYDSEVAAAFDADVLQFRVAGAFGLGNLNFPEFAALYRGAPRFDDEEYNYCLQDYERRFVPKDTIRCPVEGCDSTFQQRSQVPKHIKIHHKEVAAKRPSWICEISDCKHIANSATALKRHITDNHKEKTFPCTEEGCSGMFVNAGALQKHVKKTHRS